MKVKNLAFFGVMASIFGLSSAAEATNLIASKRYVDTVAGGKVDTSSVNTTATLTDSSNSIPSELTVKSALEAISVPGTTDSYVANGTTAITGTGVTAALGTLDGGTINITEGQPVTTVSQTDGKVSASSGTISAAGIADGAITAAKIADGTITSTQINDGAVTSGKLASGAVTYEKVASAAKTTTVATTNASDTKFPTEAAVRTAVDNAKTAAQTIAQATQNAASNSVVTSVTTTNGSVSAVTSSQITNNHIADNANISYQKMSSGLNEFDRPTIHATCTSTSPCFLSYDSTNGYTWMNMEM